MPEKDDFDLDAALAGDTSMEDSDEPARPRKRVAKASVDVDEERTDPRIRLPPEQPTDDAPEAHADAGSDGGGDHRPTEEHREAAHVAPQTIKRPTSVKRPTSIRR